MTLSLHAEYAKSTLLDKARMESRVWDRLVKSGQRPSNRVEYLKTVLGADRFSGVRTGLLKRGLRDPSVWGKLSDGSLSYEDARRIASRLGSPPKARVSEPAEQPCVTSEKAETPRTNPASGLDLRVFLSDVVGFLKSYPTDKNNARDFIKDSIGFCARYLSDHPSDETSIPPESSSPPRPSKGSRAKKPSYRGPLDQELRELLETQGRQIDAWLEERDFLNADYMDVYTTSQKLAADVKASLETFAFKMNDIRGTRPPPLRWDGDGIEEACRFFDVPYEVDDRGFLSSVAYTACRKSYRGMLARHHPDKGGDRQEYQQTLDMFKRIEAHRSI